MVEDLLKQVMAKTIDMKAGKIFTIDSLFTENEWNSISKQDKIQLGSKFRREVDSSSNLRILSRNTKGIRRFQKLN